MLRKIKETRLPMALNPTLREQERERVARHVLDLVKERGSEIPWTIAMAESGRMLPARLRHSA